MKKIQIILTLVILSGLIFNGCKLLEQEVIQDAPQDLPVEQEQEMTADSFLDDQLFNDATLNNDSEKCMEILDEGLKEECLKITTSMALIEEAKVNLDKSICDKIEVDRYKENCNNELDELIAINNEDEEFNKLLEEYRATTDEAVEKGDISLCDNIDNTDEKQICIMNVILNPQYTGTDPEICEIIENEMLVQDCKASTKWTTEE